MAIDTENKRRSVTGIMPVADGTIDASDRAAACRIYAGLTYGLPPEEYVFFDPAKPDPSNQIESDIEAIRDNFNALADALLIGVVPGFNYSWSGGYAWQPTQQFYKNGDIWIRLTNTWNADGNPTNVLFELSINGGSSYETVKTDTYTWDANGNVNGITRI